MNSFKSDFSFVVNLSRTVLSIIATLCVFSAAEPSLAQIISSPYNSLVEGGDP